MRLKLIWIFPIIIVFLFGGIRIADGLNFWQTESTKVPQTIKEGEFAGMADPADIRGSYSFGDIANAFDIEAEIIAKAFDIESNQPSLVLAKELEVLYGETESGLEIGTGAIRQFVALYTGLPYEGYDAITTAGIDILKEEGKWSEELEDKYKDVIVDLSIYDIINKSGSEETSLIEANNSVVSEDENNKATDNATGTEHDEDEIGVKGKTTVAELIGWGITLEQIEDTLGVSVPNENLLIRDICTQNSLSFGEIKETFNAMLVNE